MSVIEFRTLGTMDLRAADGRELHSLLAQPKRIALLAYLCIAEPRGYHRRDTLLGLFWPDSDQEHARTSLRKSLHILRRSLGEDAILSRGDEEVAVNWERIACDVVSFEALVRNNRFQHALDLYGGDLLTGFFVDDAPEFEQWVHAERNRLRAAAARAAYSVAEDLQRKGDYVGAVSLARRSLALADTDERALQKLITLLFKAGDRTSAVETYEEFARRLAAEYQTEPSAETRSLIERIRSGIEDAAEATEDVAKLGGRRREPSATDSLSISGGTGERARRNGVRARKLFAAAVITILITSAFIWGLMRPAGARQVVRYTLAVDSDEVMAPGASYWTRLAISPDGKRLAYIGGPNWELLLRRRDELRATTVSDTRRAETPFFSPDGQRVGFLREEHVYITDSDGAVKTVCDSLAGVAGATWATDGFIYVDGRGYVSLLRVPAKPGARPEWFTTLDSAAGEIDHTWPDALPNGKGVIFTITSTAAKGSQDSLSYAIGVAEIPSGKHRVIVNDAMYARYAASGHLLYVTIKQTLMVVPFDQNSMKVTGEPKALIQGMRLGRFGSADVAVSETGTLLYATGGGPGEQELVWMTRNGKLQPIDPDWIGDFWAPVLSPDGKRVAISRRLDAQRSDIWVKQLDRGPSVRLTLEQAFGEFPAWTPDGKSVTFLSYRNGSYGYWTRRADGSAPAILQVPEKIESYMPVWSPDGKWLVYSTDASAADSGNIVGIRPGVDRTRVPLVATNFREFAPAVSPDGRWLAYVSNETGQYEIYVVPFPDTHAARWVISSHGGADPQWSPRGNELFYRDDAGNLVAVEVTTRPTFSVGRTTPLFSTERLSISRQKRYAVSPDARRFLMIQSALGGPERLIVVENWFEELKSKSRK